MFLVGITCTRTASTIDVRLYVKSIPGRIFESCVFQSVASFDQGTNTASGQCPFQRPSSAIIGDFISTITFGEGNPVPRPINCGGAFEVKQAQLNSI